MWGRKGSIQQREDGSRSMPVRKRRDWARITLTIALVMVGLDLAAYFGLDRPLAHLAAREEQQFTLIRLDWLREKARWAQLEKRSAAIPVEDHKLRTFLEHHIPPRREGFSRAALLIQHLTQESGVQLSGIAYNVDRERGEPFEHLGLRVSVEGPFAGLLTFAHQLETASDFIVVRSFKFTSVENNGLGLQLRADLYLMP